ncbi:MAG TPA: hypothetical protein VIV11_37330 [Kofleriaceae bacterium]
MRVVLAVLVSLAACGDNVRGNISIASPGAWSTVFDDFVALTEYPGLVRGTGGDFHIEIVEDAAIPLEGYRLEVAATAHGADGAIAYIVSASDVLGAQYGASAALENLGFRFRHPFDIYAPREPKDQGRASDVVHRPEIRVRGFQLHTLHPIEAYFAFWEPSPGNTYDAHRIIDWLIKNRGNYVQWLPLDNIMEPTEHEKWKPFTQELITYAHARGIRVGLNIQLFGNSNLQHAFDLYDDPDFMEPIAESIDKRLPLIAQDLPFDVYDLSFGEFFNTAPQTFIDSTNEVARLLRVHAPQAEMHALVHVGATQRVTYMNRDLLYYFLLQYADPLIVPDIHTVMYYNLYDDAGGAYHHDDFGEHRQYLLDRMCADLPVAYQPETAYWVAFDNSIPTFLPLYVYSRWRDLDGLSKEGCGPLDNHMLFSTGWEWGYWLNDYTALRASYELAPPGELIADAYGTDLGANAAALVTTLAAEQKRALIDQRLAGYLASRDVIIDAGDKFDPPIISQPRRVFFDEVVAPNFDVDGFEADVVAPLKLHADNVAEIEDDLDALSLADSRWSRELRDGVEIDRLRTLFIHAAYSAVVAKARGASGQAEYDRASELYDRAKQVVASRHGDLHDNHYNPPKPPNGRKLRLLDRTENWGQYQYGYLYMADTLCFWERELVQVGAILGNTTMTPPGCLF